jgi:hypothetical protein
MAPDHDHDGRHHHGCDPGRQHLRGERAPAGVGIGEDQKVGEVRTGKQQRRRVRHEDGAVEKRRLVDPPVASGVEKDRRQEHHRGVEVQDDGDGGHQRHHR